MAADTDAVLAAVARHDAVLASQVALAGEGNADQAARAMDGLVDRGLLARLRVLPGRPSCYWITRAGLDAIDSKLPEPTVEVGTLRHRLGAAQACARAEAAKIPTKLSVLSRRELVAADFSGSSGGARAASLHGPYGLRVGGAVPHAASGLHHPDVVLRFPRAWLALEVILGVAQPIWLTGLLRAFGSDARYARVIFLVEEERVARSVEEAAGSVGLAEMVNAQWMTFA